jgi:uncharacterized FlaG/YvyC family protein
LVWFAKVTFVQHFERDLRFSIDRDSDSLVVKIGASETRQFIRQLAS